MHEAVRYIHDHAQALRDEHAASDAAGQLTPVAQQILEHSGGMRLLQAISHGGYEAHAKDFYEWARAVGRYNPSAGWVAGVVGIHPWEVALVDHKLQDEIYGENPNTWVASPYAPEGQAVRERDGFRFSGRWQYSTGTDHCQWIVLGGVVIDEDADDDAPPEMRHFFLPRGDYEIVENSWHVMGLSGTGSKDIVVDGALIPEYRTVNHFAMMEGAYAEGRPDNALYSMPFGCIFSGAIASATFGIAEGALEQYRDYLETRVSASGVVGKTDPYQQEALAEVEADLAAGIVHLDAMIDTWLEQLAQGQPISKGQRLEFRRNQVRAVQRVLFGVDKLFSRAGSAAIWTTRPLERFWRDLRTGGTHICDAADTIYGAWVQYACGDEDVRVPMY
ncbi:MAG: acyl-CoA dehydrogenase [Pseudomonadota bacterium]